MIAAGVIDIDSGAKLKVDTANLVYKKGTNYQIVENISVTSQDLTFINNPSGTTDINAISNSNINVNSTNSNIGGLLRFTTFTNSGSLYLNASALSANEAGIHNPNLIKIYEEIGNLTNPSGEISSFNSSLFGMSNSSQINNALNSVAPQDLDSINNQVFYSGAKFIKAIETRLDSIRYRKEIDKGKIGVASGDVVQNKSIWGQLMDSSSKQGLATNAEGYKSDLWGLVFGADNETSDDLIVGVAFGFTESSINSITSAKNTDVDNYQVNLYANKEFDKMFVNGVLSLAYNKYSSTRFISSSNKSANADYDGFSYMGKVGIGSVRNLGGGFNIVPRSDLILLRNVTDGYREDGAGTLNLVVSKNEKTFVESKTGFDLGYNHRLKNTLLRSGINIAYNYDFSTGRVNADTSFSGQPGVFNFQGSKINRSGFTYGANVTAFDVDNFEFSAKFELERRHKYSEDTILGQVAYKF